MGLRREHDELRPVVLPADEQPHAPAGEAAPLVTRDVRGRLTSSAAARALAKMPRGSTFAPRDIVCDPAFTPHNRRRREWLRKRRAELHTATGGVSSGVGAMLVAASWMYAAGEYAAEQGARTGDVERFKAAASLTATARTHDMGAWELAVREATARRDAAPVDLNEALGLPIAGKGAT